MISPRKVHRGIYVSLLSSKIGNYILPLPLTNILKSQAAQATLLGFLDKWQFDSLSLYDLPKIWADGTLENPLASFMIAARALGVVEINAVVSQSSDCAAISNFSNHTGIQFDGIVLEREFWNASDVDAAFKAFMSTVYAIQKQGVTPPMITPYIGWLDTDPVQTLAQVASQIAKNSGRVFTHAYVKDPSSAWGYISPRVTALQAARPSVPIWPIFSAEGMACKAGSEVFMGDWLHATPDPLNTAELKVSLAAPSFTPAGFQYYEYAFLSRYLS